MATVRLVILKLYLQIHYSTALLTLWIYSGSLSVTMITVRLVIYTSSYTIVSLSICWLHSFNVTWALVRLRLVLYLWFGIRYAVEER
jgi:hypothetical protein